MHLCFIRECSRLTEDGALMARSPQILLQSEDGKGSRFLVARFC